MSRVVLVTGGSRGLGLATAKRLCAEGYTVVGTGRSITDEFKQLAEQVSANKDKQQLHFEKLDLGDQASLHPFVTRITETYGPIYGLVNNAALAHDGVLATMHESQIAELMQVNVTSTIILTKYALRPMLLSGSGRIVNVASIVASTGYNGLSVYAASKAALLGFGKSLARELGKAKITVNSIAPGYLETQMSAGISDKNLQRIVNRTPLGSLASVDDVAGAVNFLLSPDANMITGTVITVDGGNTA